MKPKRLPPEEFNYIYSKVPRLCVEVIVKTKNGVVLTKRTILPGKGKWHIPGGTVLKGETLIGAVKRVALDELGIKINVKKLLGVIEYQIYKHGGHPFGVAYLVEPLSANFQINEQSSDVKYFQKLPENIFPEQKRFLTEHLKIK